MEIEPQQESDTQQQSLAIATTVDNIHVKYLRRKGAFNNLREWMDAPNNIYVGRAGRVYINKVVFPYQQSTWANPFVSKPGKTLTREESLARYETHIREIINKDPAKKEELLALRGKNLGCWCKPESCHADVLVKLINELSTNSE
jgi:hypothetical protein